MSARRTTAQRYLQGSRQRELLGLSMYIMGFLVVAAVVLPTAASASRSVFMMGGGSGGGTLPPLPGNAPGIADVTPLDPANNAILAQLLVERPHHHGVVLRSPDGRRLVLPNGSVAGGVFVFTVAEGSHWLLTVTDSEIVDVPVSAGQNVQILVP